MSESHLLFIMGRQRAGKDTIADYLVNYYRFTKISLAKPVYAIGRDVFGMAGKDRGLLIEIGIKMREIDPLVFPHALWRSVAGDLQSPLPENTRIVVPDVRFPNEWDFFKARGGIALRVNSNQAIRRQRPGFTAEYETDPTETGMDTAPTDMTFTNEDTYGALYDAVDRYATQTLGLTRRG